MATHALCTAILVFSSLTAAAAGSVGLEFPAAFTMSVKFPSSVYSSYYGKFPL